MLTLGSASACHDSSDEAPAAPLACAAPAPRSADLILTGSGIGMIAAQTIAEAHLARTGAPIELPEPLGSRAGLEALRAGAIDVALIARPLRPEEQRDATLLATPLATITVSLVAHTSRADALDQARLAAIYRGELDRWPDDTPITPLYRERGDSNLQALIAHADPALAAALSQPPPHDALVLYTDPRMRQALERIPGAVGFVDTATARAAFSAPPHRVLECHTCQVPLLLVSRAPSSPAIEALRQTLAHPHTRARLESLGYTLP